MADENTNEEVIEETAPEAEAEVEEPAAEVEAVEEPAAEAEPVDEPEVEQPAAEAEPVDEPVEEPAEEPAEEPVAEAEPVEEPAAEPAEPAEEAPAEEPAAEAEPAAAAEPAPMPSGPRKKKKRVPRSLRRTRTKRLRERPAERRPIVRLPKPEHERGRTQERQGVVVSAASDKTIVVRVDVVKAHRMYKKVIKRSTKLHAHDEENEAKVGDIVRIVETRPLSKQKRWRLQQIVEAAK